MGKRAHAVFGATVLILSGCAVGGQYGYSSALAPAPKSLASPNAGNLENLARAFLERELRSGCGSGVPRIDGYSNGYSVEFKVRGLRGCIITGGRSWELIQVTFTPVGHNPPQISVTLDAWLASGFIYPPDSQFTKSMEPESSGSLTDFARKLASDFSSYIGA